MLAWTATWMGIVEGWPAHLTFRPRRLRGLALGVGLVAAYAYSAITYGLGGRMGVASTVVSSDQSALPVAQYIRIAEDQDWIFLAPCTERGNVIQVPKASLQSIVQEKVAPRSNLFDNDPYRYCP